MSKEKLSDFESKVYKEYKKIGSKLLQTLTEKEDERIGLVVRYDCDFTDEAPDLVSPDCINAGAHTLGRRADQVIIDHLSANAGDSVFGDGMTASFVLSAYEKLKHYDNLFAIVGWRQWGELLEIKGFEDADYVGNEELQWEGTQAKKWLGTTWIPHSSLHRDDNNYRHCLWYDKSAIIHADGQDLKTTIDWFFTKDKYLTNFSMSQGAKIIDNNGVLIMKCKEI